MSSTNSTFDRAIAAETENKNPFYANLEETILAYETSMSLLADKNKIPIKGRERERAQVDLILKFRKDWVNWARVEGDQVISAGIGKKGGAWAAIYPADHPFSKDSPNCLSISTNTSINLLRIVPCKVDTYWLSTFFVHELSHLRDRVLKIEKANAAHPEFLDGEVRAYDFERDAMNILSDGKWAISIDQILKSIPYRDIKDLVTQLQELPDPLIRTIVTVHSKVEAFRPYASKYDYSLRLGSYQVALAFRAIRKLKIKEPEKRKLLHRSLDAFMYGKAF